MASFISVDDEVKKMASFISVDDEVKKMASFISVAGWSEENGFLH